MSGWRAPIDLLTLILILLAGVELGLIGFFGFSLLTWIFGDWHRFAYDAIGLAAVWQLTRQRILG
jgi:uncharacterized membrane protein YuzA (DUF378 family)